MVNCFASRILLSMLMISLSLFLFRVTRSIRIHSSRDDDVLKRRQPARSISWPIDCFVFSWHFLYIFCFCVMKVQASKEPEREIKRKRTNKDLIWLSYKKKKKKKHTCEYIDKWNQWAVTCLKCDRYAIKKKKRETDRYKTHNHNKRGRERKRFKS